MLRVLVRCLLVIVPVTVGLIVAGLWLVRQPGARLSPLMLNLRDVYNTQAAIYAFDLQAGLSLPVVRYSQNFVGKTAGWSWPVFSDDGRSVAYVRRERGRQWIGVSDSARWRPVEFEASVPPSAQDIQLTWLPSGRALVVSYTRADLDVLVGRQLLDLSGTPENARLVDWPYVCDALFSAAVDTRPALLLGCSYHPELTGAHATIGVLYDFEAGTLEPFGRTALREVAPVDDLLYPNWVYSPAGGLVYVPRSADDFPVLNWLAPGSAEVMPLRTGAIVGPRFHWSPDGTRLLIEQLDPRTWTVFDVALNREVARFGGADIDVTIGYGWYNDARHVAYVTLRSGSEPESLHVRSVDGEDVTLPMTRRVTDVAWIRP